MARCSACGYDVQLSSFHRHASGCAGAPLPPTARYWPPHEFVKKGYFSTWPGLPDPHAAKKDVIWEALGEPWIRASVDQELQAILQSALRLGVFDHNAFRARITISKEVYQPRTYYRKMSEGEWNAVRQLANPFQGTFNYMNTEDYRYWMSSSLRKVQAFGNRNAADAGGIIVRIVFNADPIVRFAANLAPHQMTGVQADASKVAVHREGFAEIGNLNTTAHLQEVLGPPRLHHNLGFTSTQSAALNAIKQTFARI
jgi:hypothetical protein